ncbi:MAG: hypothetical protein KDK34_20720, partial [Leptospiraceae bacterium]|nr:hypothetical protein [Leptospiraceae bacterium]
FVIGTIGAVLLDFALSTFFIDVVNWLMKPRIGNDQYVTRINLIAAFIGAALFVYILNHINHDRERRR